MLPDRRIAWSLLPLAACAHPALEAAGTDRATDAAGKGDSVSDPSPPSCGPAIAPPARVLFIGNSFTAVEDVPGQFRELAISAGLPAPTIATRAIGGQTLEGHRADPDPAGAVALVDQGWDVVVLQEHSLRPTDGVGPAERFKADATWFTDRARAASPSARVVLYETWARLAPHEVYPATFADAAAMQAQLRFHYHDAAERYVPEHAASAPVEVAVAHAGDAWERALGAAAPIRLHGPDNYHQNAEGAHLSARVLFGTVYRHATVGLSRASAGAAAADAHALDADWATGFTAPAPAVGCRTPLEDGDELRVDFGDLPTEGWPSTGALRGILPLPLATGELTTASVATFGFSGGNPGGRPDNELGLPATASADTLYVGTFDGHAAALPMRASVVVSGVDDGAYRLTLFASRDGDDEGNGRLTRYQLGERVVDLDVVDNRARTAVFDDVRPDAHGRIPVEIMVSPDGTARFAYLGTLSLVRTGP